MCYLLIIHSSIQVFIGLFVSLSGVRASALKQLKRAPDFRKITFGREHSTYCIPFLLLAWVYESVFSPSVFSTPHQGASLSGPPRENQPLQVCYCGLSPTVGCSLTLGTAKQTLVGDTVQGKKNGPLPNSVPLTSDVLPHILWSISSCLAHPTV